MRTVQPGWERRFFWPKAEIGGLDRGDFCDFPAANLHADWGWSAGRDDGEMESDCAPHLRHLGCAPGVDGPVVVPSP